MRGKPATVKNTHTQKGLRLAVLFCFLVIGIIVFSVGLRAALAVKGSSFGDFRYNILVNSTEPEIISIAKNDEDEKIEVLEANKEDMENISAPINSVIDSKDRLTQENFKTKLIQLLFKAQSNIPILDKLKIAIFIFRTDSDEINFISSPIDAHELSSILRDRTLSQETVPIQVINASGVSGLGNRLANTITAAGGSVVLVTSQDKAVRKSIIKYKNSSQTFKYLSSYLGFSAEKTQLSEVADVIIILGEDSALTKKF